LFDFVSHIERRLLVVVDGSCIRVGRQADASAALPCLLLLVPVLVLVLVLAFLLVLVLAATPSCALRFGQPIGRRDALRFTAAGLPAIAFLPCTATAATKAQEPQVTPREQTKEGAGKGCGQYVCELDDEEKKERDEMIRQIIAFQVEDKEKALGRPLTKSELAKIKQKAAMLL